MARPTDPAIFAGEVGVELYLQLYTVLPNRAGHDFVAHLITLAQVQDTLLAQINRTTWAGGEPSSAPRAADLGQIRASFANAA